MGVPGLWDVLNKAGKSRSLVHLAVVNGFEKNPAGRRGYRVGVDASIWFHHAAYSKEGENRELRGLFFRLISFATLPIIPLFIFDGRERPKIKRGSKLGKSGSHPLVKEFKKFLDAFGMEWREARGEAEAELAYLNEKGHIDAILTDDCDALLFGARTIIKNISSKLSGNKNNLAKNSEEKTDKFHTMTYDAIDIQTDPTIALSRGGLILFALLAGGDYHNGVERVGPKIAHGLARCNFGDELLNAYENLRNYNHEFTQFLQQWRERVNLELKENRRGYLPHRTTLSLPGNFPDLEVLANYANPINSGSGREGASSSIALRDKMNLDLAKIAQLCEQFFEWGYREKIIERFRNLLWPCAVMHVLRRAALEVDAKARNNEDFSRVGTPASLVRKYLSAVQCEDQYEDVFVRRQERPTAAVIDTDPLVVKVVSSRQHTSTDGLLEYRIEVSPVQLVRITTLGIKGTRQELPTTEGSRQRKNAPPQPNEVLRLWIPASVLSLVHPSMVAQFVDSQTQKKGKGKGKASRQMQSASDEDLPSQKKGKGKGKANCQMQAVVSDEEDEELPSTSRARMVIYQALDNSREVGQAVVLDPWFISDTPHLVTSFKRANCAGFLFTSPNPDLDELVEDKSKVAEDNDDDSEADYPLTQFDRMIDHILSAPVNGACKSKKRKIVEKPHLQNTTNERSPKRQKMSRSSKIRDSKTSSSKVLEALDLSGLF